MQKQKKNEEKKQHKTFVQNLEIDRDAQLQLWLQQILTTPYTCHPLNNDASFRRYFRVTQNDKTFVVMDAPPDKEPCDNFMKVQALLFQQGLHVPEIIAKDENGFLLLTDFGDHLYLDRLIQNSDAADHLYSTAITALIQIQQLTGVAQEQLPHFDETFIVRELNLFKEWYLQGLLKRQLTAAENLTVDNTFDFLVKKLKEQAQTFVHRDYHSRNLMILENEDVGIIDFQDAVYGPITYDLVSMLRDCYIVWPDEKVKQWVEQYRLQAQEAGVLAQIEKNEFLSQFYLTGIQRHLKVLGIFSRLHLRDGKSKFLNDIPRILNYLHSAIALFPECKPLLNFLPQAENTSK